MASYNCAPSCRNHRPLPVLFLGYGCDVALSLSLYCQGLQWHTKNMLALVIVAIGVVPALAGELHPSVRSLVKWVVKVSLSSLPSTVATCFQWYTY